MLLKCNVVNLVVSVEIYLDEGIIKVKTQLTT